MTSPEYLTAEEASKILRNQSPFWVTRECRAGRIPASKVAGRWLITRADLDAYVEANKNTPKETAPRRRRQRRAS